MAVQGFREIKQLPRNVVFLCSSFFNEVYYVLPGKPRKYRKSGRVYLCTDGKVFSISAKLFFSVSSFEL